jgi:Na+/H+-translocating membrane pyrophosphatase
MQLVPLHIGFVTEYFTSHTYSPVREVARSTETGAATNIIYGLALGRVGTPGCQIGHVDHTGCHQLVVLTDAK